MFLFAEIGGIVLLLLTLLTFLKRSFCLGESPGVFVSRGSSIVDVAALGAGRTGIRNSNRRESYLSFFGPLSLLAFSVFGRPR